MSERGIEQSGQIMKEPLVKRVLYGAWDGTKKVIESQSPEAWAGRIVHIIDEKIVPKLSPKQQEWFDQHHEGIQEAATYAGVGITTGEIVLATVALDRGIRKLFPERVIDQKTFLQSMSEMINAGIPDKNVAEELIAVVGVLVATGVDPTAHDIFSRPMSKRQKKVAIREFERNFGQAFRSARPIVDGRPVSKAMIRGQLFNLLELTGHTDFPGYAAPQILLEPPNLHPESPPTTPYLRKLRKRIHALVTKGTDRSIEQAVKLRRQFNKEQREIQKELEAEERLMRLPDEAKMREIARVADEAMARAPYFDSDTGEPVIDPRTGRQKIGIPKWTQIHPDPEDDHVAPAPSVGVHNNPQVLPKTFAEEKDATVREKDARKKKASGLEGTTEKVIHRKEKVYMPDPGPFADRLRRAIEESYPRSNRYGDSQILLNALLTQAHEHIHDREIARLLLIIEHDDEYDAHGKQFDYGDRFISKTDKVTAAARLFNRLFDMLPKEEHRLPWDATRNIRSEILAELWANKMNRAGLEVVLGGDLRDVLDGKPAVSPIKFGTTFDETRYKKALEGAPQFVRDMVGRRQVGTMPTPKQPSEQPSVDTGGFDVPPLLQKRTEAIANVQFQDQLKSEITTAIWKRMIRLNRSLHRMGIDRSVFAQNPDLVADIVQRAVKIPKLERRGLNDLAMLVNGAVDHRGTKAFNQLFSELKKARTRTHREIVAAQLFEAMQDVSVSTSKIALANLWVKLGLVGLDRII